MGQGSSALQELRYFIWPDGPQDQLSLLKTACPRLQINPDPSMFSGKRLQKLPTVADSRLPLDIDSASRVSQIDWPAKQQQGEPLGNSDVFIFPGGKRLRH